LLKYAKPGRRSIQEEKMRIFAAVSVCFVLALCSVADDYLVRVALEDGTIEETFSMEGWRVFQSEIPGRVDLIVSDREWENLIEMGYDVTLIKVNPDWEAVDVDPEYHTYEEMIDELQNIAAQFPDICQLFPIGETTQFQENIYCMKLSDNASIEEDELSLFYIGGHHACELMGIETMLYMIDQFTSNYGIDPEITRWIDDYEIFIVPLMNPDGHNAVLSDIHPYWRKSARDINHNGIPYQWRGTGTPMDDMEGVDLNRNYDWYWSNGYTNPRVPYYIGPYPASETETQAIVNLAYSQRFVCGLNLHCYGEVVIYPWDIWPSVAPDHLVLDQMAAEMAAQFEADSGGFYDTLSAYGMNGQSRNWFYGVTGALPFLVELNSVTYYDSGDQLAEKVERYKNGCVYLLERLSGPGVTGHVTDAVTGEPLQANVEIVGMTSMDVNPRYSDPLYGRFTRLLLPGSYSLQAEREGYEPYTVVSFDVSDTLTVLELPMQPLTAAGSIGGQTDSAIEQKFTARIAANNQLSLKFALQQESPVSFAIFNLLGQEVFRSGAEYYQAGQHQLEISLPRLASGVYYAAIESPQFKKVAKVVLAK